ncbi:hypothetical protein VTN00DRAFT_1758 [Thermoascus crustaceus]|uniref:uncharacterized protein n=1 Tax=Thermoascus crustaceus TaxID=5088 RepID=UPI00374399AD
MVLMPCCDKWRALRKIMHQVLNTRQADKFKPYQELESKKLLYDYLHKPDKRYIANQRFVNSVIVSVVFGRRSELDDPEMKELFNSSENFFWRIHSQEPILSMASSFSTSCHHFFTGGDLMVIWRLAQEDVYALDGTSQSISYHVLLVEQGTEEKQDSCKAKDAAGPQHRLRRSKGKKKAVGRWRSPCATKHETLGAPPYRDAGFGASAELGSRAGPSVPLIGMSVRARPLSSFSVQRTESTYPPEQKLPICAGSDLSWLRSATIQLASAPVDFEDASRLSGEGGATRTPSFKRVHRSASNFTRDRCCQWQWFVSRVG